MRSQPIPTPNINRANAKVRIYVLQTSKVYNKCVHICAMDPNELTSDTFFKVVEANF